MSITFRPGKLDPDPSKPRLSFAAFARPTAVQVPADVDWCTAVDAPDDWGVLGNDRWGDCVFAGQAHETVARTTLAGLAFVPSEDEVLLQYSLVTGFDPAAGEPGSNPTDQGALLQDALNFWRRRGFPAGTPKLIAAFAEVDHRDAGQLLTALYLFGSLSIGLQVPDYAMDQFDAGQPWDVRRNGRNLGGHAVHLARAARLADGTLRLWVITWGRVQEMTWAFWLKYVDEAWCSITDEWLRSSGLAPSGLDRAALGEQFAALTGEPDPFPPAPPQPVPMPPASDPVTAADLVLWGQVGKGAQHPHFLPTARTTARHLREWATAKGFLQSS